ncbi:hypothetical protein BC938DRAFT_480975 [Jimgerdemannia flammicorona]|uniref:Crinkler effector protein N-terminal domain-containing protein n=1 Tax=Jimgerdemannia flammicorona TaxID=994334 RepID=A0A433QH88_9FUNG|nr:hypothetical protein BC938DRAFT_480975 [Jimgerdemannia flammicorona]
MSAMRQGKVTNSSKNSSKRNPRRKNMSSEGMYECGLLYPAFAYIRIVYEKILKEITLFCLVNGDPKEKIFAVKIGKDDFVSEFKDAIKAKNENTLDVFDAKDLTLWRVSISLKDIAKTCPLALCSKIATRRECTLQMISVMFFPQKAHPCHRPARHRLVIQ